MGARLGFDGEGLWAENCASVVGWGLVLALGDAGKGIWAWE